MSIKHLSSLFLYNNILWRCFTAITLLTGISHPLSPVSQFLFMPAHAWQNTAGFAPQTYKDSYQYGSGIFFAAYNLTLYTEPDSQAKKLATIKWQQQDSTVHLVYDNGHTASLQSDRLFFCFYPKLNIAMMAVVSTTDDGWAEVVYDQKTHKTAWVQLRPDEEQPKKKAEDAEPAHFNVYQTWVEFMRLNAKSTGVYWLSGVSSYQRSLRMSDLDNAKILPVTIIRKMQIRHVRGNWLLVEVEDLQGQHPIGWVRWRDEEGNLLAFPNLSGGHLPVVTVGF